MRTADDITRREAIAEYRVVGQPPEPDLEGLVQLAASVCGVSTAVINIIDDRSQHQIAAVGFEPNVCAREDSMCAVVFRHPGHVVVPDARVDDRFRDNPFVTGEIADVRFYASSPLITPAGVPIGTLCVFDEEVRELSDQDSRALALLARQVIDVLELRRITRELGRSNEQLAHFAGRFAVPDEGVDRVADVLRGEREEAQALRVVRLQGRGAAQRFGRGLPVTYQIGAVGGIVQPPGHDYRAIGAPQ